jgi:hypothetical protein
MDRNRNIERNQRIIYQIGGSIFKIVYLLISCMLYIRAVLGHCIVTYGTVNLYGTQEHCLLVNICVNRIFDLISDQGRKEGTRKGRTLILIRIRRDSTARIRQTIISSAINCSLQLLREPKVCIVARERQDFCNL